jgi:hypothetical protein
VRCLGFPLPGWPCREPDEPLLDLLLSGSPPPLDDPEQLSAVAEMSASLADPAGPAELTGEARARTAYARTAPVGVCADGPDGGQLGQDAGLGVLVKPGQPGGDTGGTAAGRRRTLHRPPWLLLAILGIQVAFALQQAWSNTAFHDDAQHRYWLRPAGL